MTLVDKREDRKRRKAEMTKRRTHASQQRMKIITELARGKHMKEGRGGRCSFLYKLKK